MAVISALDDKPISDLEVQRTFHAINEAVVIEEFGDGTNLREGGKASHQTSNASLRELFTGGRSQNLRRVALGVIIQCFQQVYMKVSYSFVTDHLRSHTRSPESI